MDIDTAREIIGKRVKQGLEDYLQWMIRSGKIDKMMEDDLARAKKWLELSEEEKQKLSEEEKQKTTGIKFPVKK